MDKLNYPLKKNMILASICDINVYKTIKKYDTMRIKIKIVISSVLLTDSYKIIKENL